MHHAHQAAVALHVVDRPVSELYVDIAVQVGREVGGILPEFRQHRDRASGVHSLQSAASVVEHDGIAGAIDDRGVWRKRQRRQKRHAAIESDAVEVVAADGQETAMHGIDGDRACGECGHQYARYTLLDDGDERAIRDEDATLTIDVDFARGIQHGGDAAGWRAVGIEAADAARAVLGDVDQAGAIDRHPIRIAQAAHEGVADTLCDHCHRAIVVIRDEDRAIRPDCDSVRAVEAGGHRLDRAVRVLHPQRPIAVSDDEIAIGVVSHSFRPVRDTSRELVQLGVGGDAHDAVRALVADIEIACAIEAQVHGLRESVRPCAHFARWRNFRDRAVAGIGDEDVAERVARHPVRSVEPCRKRRHGTLRGNPRQRVVTVVADDVVAPVVLDHRCRLGQAVAPQEGFSAVRCAPHETELVVPDAFLYACKASAEDQVAGFIDIDPTQGADACGVQAGDVSCAVDATDPTSRRRDPDRVLAIDCHANGHVGHGRKDADRKRCGIETQQFAIVLVH